MEELVKLVCEEDGRSIYFTKKNKKNTPDKLSLKKYSKWLKKHTIHTEKK